MSRESSRFDRIDLGQPDGGVPETFAVARRECLGVGAQLGDEILVEACRFQFRGQLPPGEPGGGMT